MGNQIKSNQSIKVRSLTQQEINNTREIPNTLQSNVPGNRLFELAINYLTYPPSQVEAELNKKLERLDKAFQKKKKSIKKMLDVEHLFEYEVNNKILVSDFLSNDTRSRPIIENILKTNGNKLIIAHMGTGKSTSIISIGAELGLKIIFAVPLIVNVDQFYEKYKGITGINRIQKQNSDQLAKILNNDANNVIICTYNRVEKISQHLEKEGKIDKWTLVMDEAHNFVSQSNYRELALRKLRMYGPRYSKMILLSGTAEVLFFPLLNSEINPTIYEFKKKTSSTNKGHFKTLYSYKVDTTSILLDHLLSDKSRGKTGLRIIVQENISKLEELKKVITSNGLATDDEIYLLNARAKDSESWDEIVNNERLSPEIKYFLSTSVISDGCNIENTNVVEFFSIGWIDLTKLRQMQSRLREAPDDLIYYDIISLRENNNQVTNKFICINTQFEKEMKFTTALCELISHFSNSNIYGEELASFFKDNTSFGYQGKIFVDEFALYQILCNRYIYSPMTADPHLRINFIKKFFRFNPERVTLEEIDTVQGDINNRLYATRVEILSEKMETLFDHISRSPETVFNFVDIIDGFQKSKDLNNLKSDPVFQLLTIPLLKQITKWFKDFLDLGISIPTCIKLFKTLKGPILITAIGEDSETMKKDYDGFIDPWMVEPFIVMRLYKLINDGRQDFRNQEDRVLIIDAIRKNINPKNSTFNNVKIRQLNPRIIRSQLKKVEDILFDYERTGSNKTYSHKIKAVKTIENVFNNLGVDVPPSDIEYFKDNGWY